MSGQARTRTLFSGPATSPSARQQSPTSNESFSSGARTGQAPDAAPRQKAQTWKSAHEGSPRAQKLRRLLKNALRSASRIGGKSLRFKSTLNDRSNRESRYPLSPRSRSAGPTVPGSTKAMGWRSGALGYWSKKVTDSAEHRRWLVQTAIKTKSEGARDILTYATTKGSVSSFDDLEIGLEQLRIQNPSDKALRSYRGGLWKPGVRQLARLLYCQRTHPLDLLNAALLYRILASAWGHQALEDIDRSYYSDLLVDAGEFEDASDLLALRSASNSDRALSQRFLQLNAHNPFIGNPEAIPEAWERDLNEIFREFGFTPIALKDGEQRPFFRLNGEALPEGGEIPLVSIVMPVYEPDHSTDVAISSLLSQSWWNIELIIVDDCSPSRDLSGNPTDFRTRLMEWGNRDSRIKLVFNSTNYGAYYARNTGYDLASGKYITVADKDDWHHPQKIAYQARQMEAEPDRVAHMVNWVRVNEDLRFLVRWGPDRVVHPSFASLMFRREQLKKTFGYWDEVRKSADGEMKQRIQSYYGIDIQPEYGPPLAFSLIGTNNLTANDLGLGYLDDDRRIYQFAYKTWHEAIRRGEASPFLPRTAASRTFPAPNSFLPDRPQYQDFDLIVLSEFGFEAGNNTILRNELQAATRAGLRVGIIPCHNFLIKSASIRHITHDIQSMVDSGQVERVPLSGQMRTKLLVIRWPSIMQVTHGGASQIEAEHVLVVANHAPHEAGDNRISYDTTTISKNVYRLFGKRPLWAPESEQIRKIIGKTVPWPELFPDAWGGILPEPLPELRTPNFGDIPTIGRHGRDHWTKWPGSRPDLLSCYPVDGSVNVSILGGAGSPVRSGLVTPAERDRWNVYGFNGFPVNEYLKTIDFFVYFHHHTLVEAFGMAIVEAMAHGCVCILPPRFKEVFGAAAIYCEPAEVQQTIQDLWGDPDTFSHRQHVARSFVEQQASAAAFVSRLGIFGIEPVQEANTSATVLN